MFHRLLKLAILLLITCSCSRISTDRSFYYWKTTFRVSDTEQKIMQDLDIKKLYIRFFDVDWETNSKIVFPVGKINFADKVPAGFQVVPVVYLTNKTLINISYPDIASLANNIYRLVNVIAFSNSISFAELQIDCDWNETTKDKYFHLLKLLKTQLRKNNTLLSATIRLHQVKYEKRTGVPPVDRGMLMFYNMGKISFAGNHNSIYNKADAAKYTGYIKKYSLPVDIALPLFSWGIHIRNNKPFELLNNFTVNDFRNNINFTTLDNQSYVAAQSFFFKGFYFMKNDLVKVEEITPPLSKEAADMVAGELKFANRSVALFHLDSLTLSRYEKKNIEKIFNSFD
jgi:hypothetical protein